MRHLQQPIFVSAVTLSGLCGVLTNRRGPQRATERGLLGARGLRRRARWGRRGRVPSALTLRPFAALCGSIARRADACAHWMLGELINRRGPQRATEKGPLVARGLRRRARWGRRGRVPNAPTLRPFAALCGSIARRADACAHWMLGELINRRGPQRATERGLLGARGLRRRARWGRRGRVPNAPTLRPFAALCGSIARRADACAHWMLGELINRRGPQRATERGLLGARGLRRRARWGRRGRVPSALTLRPFAALCGSIARRADACAHWMLGELINHRGPRRATERGLLGARGLRRRARGGRWVRVRAHWMLGELTNRLTASPPHRGRSAVRSEEISPRRATEGHGDWGMIECARRFA